MYYSASSASWIIKNIIHNKGGLHNRLTHQIHLEPFDLKDTQLFLRNSKINLNEEQVLQIYLAIGGIPYYLSKIEKGLSAVQNIEQLAFRKRAFLLEEFDKLFSALFEESDVYQKILKVIAKHRYGIGQEVLLKKLGKSLYGQGGKDKLKSLQDTNFILSFKPYAHSRKGLYYKVIDEYTLFYFNWLEPIKDTLLEKSLEKGY